MKLDLHGVRHQDVSRALDVFFWEAITKRQSQVEVICGNSQAMKDLVIEVCKEYGFTWNEGLINKAVIFIDI